MQHTIKGRMAYAPMVLRLRPGYSENNVQGEELEQNTKLFIKCFGSLLHWLWHMNHVSVKCVKGNIMCENFFTIG